MIFIKFMSIEPSVHFIIISIYFRLSATVSIGKSLFSSQNITSVWLSCFFSQQFKTTATKLSLLFSTLTSHFETYCKTGANEFLHAYCIKVFAQI